jgi:hypothetical protein
VHLATVDSHGRVVIALDNGSPGPGRIVYLDGKGHKVDAFGMKGDFPDGSCDVTVDAAGYTFVDSCFGETRNTQVFDRTHRLVGAWYGGPFALSPRFGPNGEVFTPGVDGTVLRLKVALPNA